MSYLGATPVRLHEASTALRGQLEDDEHWEDEQDEDWDDEPDEGDDDWDDDEDDWEEFEEEFEEDDDEGRPRKPAEDW